LIVHFATKDLKQKCVGLEIDAILVDSIRKSLSWIFQQKRSIVMEIGMNIATAVMERSFRIDVMERRNSNAKFIDFV
jgi:hypothetical protein